MIFLFVINQICLPAYSLLKGTPIYSLPPLGARYGWPRLFYYPPFKDVADYLPLGLQGGGFMAVLLRGHQSSMQSIEDQGATPLGGALLTLLKVPPCNPSATPVCFYGSAIIWQSHKP
jgi:hypothetical protein